MSESVGLVIRIRMDKKPSIIYLAYLLLYEGAFDGKELFMWKGKIIICNEQEAGFIYWSGNRNSIWDIAFKQSFNDFSISILSIYTVDL